MLSSQGVRAASLLLRSGSGFARCLPRSTTIASVSPLRCSPTTLQVRGLAGKVAVSAVKELRERTGSPMMDCKNALEASGGNIDEAIDWLRKKGMASAAKKESRRSADGLIGVLVNDTAKRGAIVELNAETDFVAKNGVFQKLARDICALQLAQPMAFDQFKQEKLASGPKSDGEVSVEDAVKEMVATVGENCQLRSAETVEVDSGLVVRYVHTPMGEDVGKLGVIVALESKTDKTEALSKLGSQVAMHIAAASPLVVSVAQLPPEAVAAETKIYTEQSAASGKKEDIVARMVQGRLKKWHEEVVLLEQDFLISGQDEKKRKVKDVLKGAAQELGADVAVKAFVRVKLGEKAA